MPMLERHQLCGVFHPCSTRVPPGPSSTGPSTHLPSAVEGGTSDGRTDILRGRTETLVGRTGSWDLRVGTSGPAPSSTKGDLTAGKARVTLRPPGQGKRSGQKNPESRVTRVEPIRGTTNLSLTPVSNLRHRKSLTPFPLFSFFSSPGTSTPSGTPVLQGFWIISYSQFLPPCRTRLLESTPDS